MKSQTLSLILLTSSALLASNAFAQTSPTSGSTQTPAAKPPAPSGAAAAKPQSSTAAKKPGAATAAKPGAAAAAQTLKTDREKASYAIGANIGKSMKKEGVDLDPALIARGIKDGFGSSKLLLTDEQAQAALAAFSGTMKKKQEDQVAAIVLHNGREPLATIEVGEPPRVELSGPERRDQLLALRVHAEHPRARPSVVVLFSGDDRATWEPVAFDPPNGEVLVEGERLQGGERCFFRAVATAELRSASADSSPFELPRSRRRLYLRLPDSQCPIAPGPVPLSAMIDCRGLGAVAPDEIRWHSDLEGDLGVGYEVSAQFREGRHVITVTAPDGRGGSLAERGIIIIGGRPAGIAGQTQR